MRLFAKLKVWLRETNDVARPYSGCKVFMHVHTYSPPSKRGYRWMLFIVNQDASHYAWMHFKVKDHAQD